MKCNGTHGLGAAHRKQHPPSGHRILSGQPGQPGFEALEIQLNAEAIGVFMEQATNQAGFPRKHCLPYLDHLHDISLTSERIAARMSHKATLHYSCLPLSCLSRSAASRM